MKNLHSRRKFLKTSALAGAAGLTAPLWLSRARAADSPEELTSVLTVTNVTNASTSSDLWRRDTPELVEAALKDIPAAGPGPFQESWDSIGQNYKDPDWFRVGRSEKVTGPYFDRYGEPMTEGGGTLFLAAQGNDFGPGHFGRLLDDGVEKFSCHYEAEIGPN